LLAAWPLVETSGSTKPGVLRPLDADCGKKGDNKKGRTFDHVRPLFVVEGAYLT
jgi:hypothetical protein